VPGRRGRLHVGPPVKGLMSNPERMQPEHSSQALNVEFIRGGVTPRKGCNRTNNITEDSAVVALCKVIQSAPAKGREGTATMITGFTKSARDADNNLTSNAFIHCQLLDGGGAVTHSLDGSDFGALNNPDLVVPIRNDERSRFDACQFIHGKLGQIVVVTAPPHTFGDEIGYPTVWWSSQPFRYFRPLTARYRGASFTEAGRFHQGGYPFHGNSGAAFAEQGRDGDGALLEEDSKYLASQGIVAYSPFVDDDGRFVGGLGRNYFHGLRCRPHAGRLFFGNVASPTTYNDEDRNLEKIHQVSGGQLSSCIWYSNYMDHEGYVLENIEPPPGLDETPVSALGLWNERLVVFQGQSINVFQLSGRALPDYRVANRERGCINHASVVEDVKGALLFASSDGLYAFQGSNQLEYISRPIEGDLKSAGESRRGLEGMNATHVPGKRQVYFSFMETAVRPPRVYVMDYNYSPPSWSVFEYQAGTWRDAGKRRFFGGVAGYGEELVGAAVRTGAPGLDTYKMNAGTQDTTDGNTKEDFKSTWESAPILYNQNNMRRWRYIRPIVNPTNGQGPAAFWRMDEQAFNGDGELNRQSVELDVSGEGGIVLGAAQLGAARLGSTAHHSKRIDVTRGGVGRLGRVGVTGTGKRFDIRGFEVDVIEKKGSR